MPGLADLLKKSADDGMSDGEDDGAPDYGKSEHAAMEKFIEAVHSKDAGAAVEALKTCMDLYQHDDGGGDGEPATASPGGKHALLLIPHGK